MNVALRRFAVPVALVAVGLAYTGWVGIVFFAAAAVWMIAMGVERWLLPSVNVLQQADDWSRRLLTLAAIILGVWGVWALVEAISNPPFLRFDSFGLVSPAVGLVLFVASVVALGRATEVKRPKRYAIAAMSLSVIIGVMPLVTLLVRCDRCMS